MGRVPYVPETVIDTGHPRGRRPHPRPIDQPYPPRPGPHACRDMVIARQHLTQHGPRRWVAEGKARIVVDDRAGPGRQDAADVDDRIDADRGAACLVVGIEVAGKDPFRRQTAVRQQIQRRITVIGIEAAACRGRGAGDRAGLSRAALGAFALAQHDLPRREDREHERGDIAPAPAGERGRGDQHGGQGDGQRIMRAAEAAIGEYRVMPGWLAWRDERGR